MRFDVRRAARPSRRDGLGRTLRFAASCLLLPTALAAVGGCGGDPLSKPSGEAALIKSGPHGASALPLGDKGYVEVVVEPANGSAKNKTSQLVLAAYFFQTDLKTPLAVPTEVSATIVTPEEPTPRPVSLIAKPSAAPKAEPATRFASEVGKFEYDELQGEIKATVNGEAFTKSFRLR